MSYVERKTCCFLYCNCIKFSSRFHLEDTGSSSDHVKYLDTNRCEHFVSIQLFTHDTDTYTIDKFKYSLISPLRVSASITPSSRSSAATSKTYHDYFPLEPQGSYMWPKTVWRTFVCWRSMGSIYVHTTRDGTCVQTASMHHSITRRT
jgi:hypothetical protein